MAYHIKGKLEDISNFFDFFFFIHLIWRNHFLEFGNDTTLNYKSIALSYLVSKKLNFFKENINNLTLFPLGSSLHVQLS